MKEEDKKWLAEIIERSHYRADPKHLAGEKKLDHWIRTQHGTADWEIKLENLVGEILSQQWEETVAYLNEVDIEQNRELYDTSFAAGMEKMRKIVTTYQEAIKNKK